MRWCIGADACASTRSICEAAASSPTRPSRVSLALAGGLAVDQAPHTVHLCIAIAVDGATPVDATAQAAFFKRGALRCDLGDDVVRPDDQVRLQGLGGQILLGLAGTHLADQVLCEDLLLLNLEVERKRERLGFAMTTGLREAITVA